MFGGANGGREHEALPRLAVALGQHVGALQQLRIGDVEGALDVALGPTLGGGLSSGLSGGPASRNCDSSASASGRASSRGAPRLRQLRRRGAPRPSMLRPTSTGQSAEGMAHEYGGRSRRAPGNTTTIGSFGCGSTVLGFTGPGGGRRRPPTRWECSYPGEVDAQIPALTGEPALRSRGPRQPPSLTVTTNLISVRFRSRLSVSSPSGRAGPAAHGTAYRAPRCRGASSGPGRQGDRASRSPG